MSPYAYPILILYINIYLYLYVELRYILFYMLKFIQLILSIEKGKKLK